MTSIPLDSTDALQRKTLAQQLYDILESRITSGQLPPGARIPEEAIAEEFAVSRSPVREATARLELVGLAERVSLRERRVAVPTEAFIRDTYETWAILGAGRAYASCLAVGPEDQKALAEVVESMEVLHNARRFDDLHQITEQFHELLRKGCQNAQLYAVMADFEKFRKWLVSVYLKPNPPPEEGLRQHRQKSIAEHRQMADAFIARDLLGLTKAIQTHAFRQRDRVLEIARADLGLMAAAQGRGR
jgi:DNA-binding GntR family transcriptional regulator